jgi:NifB/MoaA-like Fe-S oxidoreductase
MEINNLTENRNIISSVIRGSIADELGVEPGDILLSINDQQVNDIIDYKYLITDDFIVVAIQKKDEEVWELEIEKDFDEDIGIIFTNPLIDGKKL